MFSCGAEPNAEQNYFRLLGANRALAIEGELFKVENRLQCLRKTTLPGGS